MSLPSLTGHSYCRRSLHGNRVRNQHSCPRQNASVKLPRICQENGGQILLTRIGAVPYTPRAV